ncbi:TetR/AcrR family transcriptional regulator [Pediococcus siamensis]|uniref:TetR/AcrR family transcriptional regulator n=1 Tax=Pediococcus siamensis TaxID=381829 RepID=UPI00399F834D
MKKKNEEKYRQIITITSHLIATEGAAMVSTTKVANLVGISQSNIYIYFKNKDDLLYQVYLSKLATMQASFAQMQKEDLSVSAQLRAYIMKLYQFATAHPEDMRVIAQLKIMPNSPLFSGNFPFKDDTKVVRKLIQAGIQAGVLRPVDPELHLTIIFNVIRRYTSNPANADYDPDQFAPVFEMIWAALKRE